MLDQNTDRMWFVIGAVIVGAAIIFIANGSLPTLFASVADTFEGSSAQATEVIDSMGRNLLDMYPIHEGSYIHNVSGNLAHDHPFHAVSDFMSITPGETYAFKTSYDNDVRVAYYDSARNMLVMNYERISADYKETVAPMNAAYVRVSGRYMENKYNYLFAYHDEWWFGTLLDYELTFKED